MAESKGCAKALRNVTRGAAPSTIAGVTGSRGSVGSGVRDEKGMGETMLEVPVYTPEPMANSAVRV